MVNCSSCGNDETSDKNFCSKCGTKINPINSENSEPSEKYTPKYPRPLPWKSGSITLILSIVIGILGVCGVGHLYIGKIRRGLVILFGPFISLILGVIIAYGTADTMPEFNEPSLLGVIESITGLFLGFWFIPFIILFFWQIFDARKLCRHYNNYLEQHGTKPW